MNISTRLLSCITVSPFATSCCSKLPVCKTRSFSFTKDIYIHGCSPRKSCVAIVHARKKKNKTEAETETERVLNPTILEEVTEDEVDDDVLLDDFEDDEEFLEEDDGFLEDELAADDAEVYVGDGAEGGGISLAGTWWDKEALAIAEDVVLSFDGELGIYAFRSLLNSTIQVRIENLTKKSGSPTLDDIEAFSTTYRAKLDEAELAKSVPENLHLEVSSPGVERVVRIPHDLERFRDRPMYVKYVTEMTETGSASESDGVFRLVSFDMETKCCTWGLADVRKNREKAGKGRPMSKKQRAWRVDTPFDSLRLVRLYSEI